MRRVAIAGCIAALAIGLSACSGGGAAAGAASNFVPNLLNAGFGDGWTDEQTKEAITPPQRIQITGNLDLTETAESIGYGPAEQRLPMSSGAVTSSFPTTGNRVRMFTARDNVLHLSWICEWVPDDPDAENCQDYHVAFDISGSEPEVLAASNSVEDLLYELPRSTTLRHPRVVVTDPSELPRSVIHTDKATGATTALLLAVAQPRETSANVYFVVNNSLKLYFGELEPSR
ncbi:hypothetical protein CJ178_30130 [Rhodococcus sp. ACPA4]|uniref:hypothetical protein n=1 Tax=Rhodococcus sp. ACPA4 TaxID=2028571 RepID=UPI000BB16296|nr:hypothetical protein [Rhodococcus sp. ACPA4]PBC35736.1 hypothetical protein CJ178_30130 [Rhodococcus sp. ACPA4]